MAIPEVLTRKTLDAPRTAGREHLLPWMTVEKQQDHPYTQEPLASELHGLRGTHSATKQPPIKKQDPLPSPSTRHDREIDNDRRHKMVHTFYRHE